MKALDLIDDRAELDAFGRELEHMVDLLDRERGLVAQFDADGVSLIAEEKQQAFEQLRRLGERALETTENGAIVIKRNDVELERVRRRVRGLADQVLRQARANALLLDDAIDLMSEKLGIKQQSGTYDSRARRRPAIRAYGNQGKTA